MNKALLIGRLTRDPEMRFLESGRAVTRFTLAVDKNMSKEKREEFRRENKPTADFISIVVWGKQAESCGEFLKKGRLVSVDGHIETGSYEDKEGIRRYTTDIVASRVGFLEWPSDSEGEKTTSSSLSDDLSGFSPVEDEDIPF